MDDCSPDDCPKICDEYARQDTRIKVIHKAGNEGLPYARKTGFENSVGDYILNIDSDDFIEPNMVEKLYSHAISGNYDMIYCNYYEHSHSGKILREVPTFTNSNIVNIKKIVIDYKPGGGVVWNKLVKRNIYEKINFPKASHSEDRYICIQILFFAQKIGYVNIALYHWVLHPESLNNNSKKGLEKYNGRYENYQMTIAFLKEKYGENLSAFEPELTKRLKWIKETCPGNPKKIVKIIIKKILCIILTENMLITIFNKLGDNNYKGKPLS